jgi:glycosyltransferase involved in cell wall biosynthesis
MTNHSKMRLIHITVYGDLPAGVRKQIKWEQQASQQLQGAQWDQLAIHGGEQKETFERRIPKPFRLILLRNFYAWYVIARLSRRYDYVLLRHMPFDPFVFLFAPFIRNRIGVHHAKEVEELRLINGGIKGRLASWLERLSGKVAVKTARAILGVTPELGYYQTQLRAPHKPHFVYANGIDVNSVELLADNRDAQQLNIAFICNTFSAWHGLDRFVDAVAHIDEMPQGVQIHLIGKVSQAQHEHINSLGSSSNVFKVYGYLESDKYRRLLSWCDIGMGSLAMDRQSLKQGTTLKVREMLALGLPIYSSHEDSSLPDSFPYYINDRVDMNHIFRFARTMKSHSRLQVRQAAEPLIGKYESMQKVVNWLKGL